jgi:hypothetical protein
MFKGCKVSDRIGRCRFPIKVCEVEGLEGELDEGQFLAKLLGEFLQGRRMD